MKDGIDFSLNIQSKIALFLTRESMTISSVLEDFANFLMIHIICNGRMGLTISRISFFSPILKKSAETVNGIPVNLRKMDSEN